MLERPASGTLTANEGGELMCLEIRLDKSHEALHGPTNGQEDASGAESDFAAEQKMHCIPAGIAWRICELC